MCSEGSFGGAPPHASESVRRRTPSQRSHRIARAIAQRRSTPPPELLKKGSAPIRNYFAGAVEPE
jgi:hypothetical protein